MAKKKAAPLPANGINTRTAAEIIGCTTRHVRTLASKEVLKSWKLGPATIVFDRDEVEEYAESHESGRKAGTVRGARPGGFKPDVND
jgi:excisionase family DNA binding protein